MKTPIASLIVVISTLATLSVAQARPMGRSDMRPNNLEYRMDQLERANFELQRQMDWLAQRVSVLENTVNIQPPVSRYTCSITDDFGGIHVGTASTQIGAEAAARQACEAKHAKFICDNPARCEQER